jgi:dihydrofolate reductase
MRKILYALLVTLDGYIEGPNGDLSWSEPNEELHRHFNDLTRRTATSLYGRRLYENMAAFWPTAHTNPSATDYEVEFAHLWQELPKVVFSKTLEKVEWNSTLMREVNPDEIARLKAQPGEYMDLGGAELAAAFRRHDLIDEYRLYIHPLVLGEGKPMFLPEGPQAEPTNLTLEDTHTFGNGVVMLRYARATP